MTPECEPAVPLSRRQSECVALAVRGFSVPEIARLLGLAAPTVYEHLRKARERIVRDEVRRRAARDASLIGWAIREGIPNVHLGSPRSPEFAPNTYGEMEQIRLPRARYPTVDDLLPIRDDADS